MKNDDFISILVEETLESKMSNKAFVTHGSFEIDVLFDKSRMCYIVSNDGKNLEIPKNWGPFKNRISNNFSINKHEDNDLIIDVMSRFFNQELSSITFKLKDPSLNIQNLLRTA